MVTGTGFLSPWNLVLGPLVPGPCHGEGGTEEYISTNFQELIFC